MIHLADVSEFQGTIDWPAYGRAFPAVIIRAHNGSRPDKRFAANRDGARSNVALRGFYHYLKAGRDPAVQAAGFCNTVAALLPGEFVAVDAEEGSGSQVERVQQWMAVVDKRLGTRSWLYSGQAFAQAHLGALVPFHDRNVWLANYRSHPPDLPCTLWQHTDAEAHAGIPAPCDCSIYQGTAAELAALLGGAPTPTPPIVVTPFPGDHMRRLDMTERGLDGSGHGYTDLPTVPAFTVVSVRVNTADYGPVPTCTGDQDFGGHARLEWVGQANAPAFGFRVWVTDG